MLKLLRSQQKISRQKRMPETADCSTNYKRGAEGRAEEAKQVRRALS